MTRTIKDRVFDMVDGQWRSMVEIADLTEIEDRFVVKALRELKADGLVESKACFGWRRVERTYRRVGG